MENPSFPNLIIIGAMKCGTTSLHDYLSKHPEIHMSEPKELHYYQANFRFPKAKYLSFFKSNKKIKGTSPQSYSKAHYLDFEDVPRQIYQDTPDVKLIYIVRDPFERMLSHALENRYGDTLSRIKYNEDCGHYWKTSMYYYQISKYLEYFKKDQIHVLTLEELKQNKLSELNKVFRFLGVKELTDESIFNYVKNTADSKVIPYFISRRFWFRLVNSLNKGLAKKLAEKVIANNYQEYLMKPRLESIIDKEVVKSIQEDSQKLKETFSVNISLWNLAPRLDE